MNGIFDDLYQVAEECLSLMYRDPANRERSWDRCYSFFQQYHLLNKEQQQAKKELACLHLGFYLASWGMFRGSGSLIYKDYTIYAEIIEILFEEQYEGLWGLDFFQDMLIGEDQISEDNEQVRLIFSLKGQIQEYIERLTIIKNHHSPEENASATDTIITKILLGTLACTPAYDTYFPRGLRVCGIDQCGSLTVGCFTRLLNIFREHGLWQRLQRHPIQYQEQPNQHPVTYPIMRVVDLYLWEKGFRDEVNPDNA